MNLCFICYCSHPGTGKYLYIDSHENGLVLSVKNGSFEENAEMVLSQPENDVSQAQHQQWYLDENTGTLRTALNDYCLDIIKGEYTRFMFIIDSLAYTYIPCRFSYPLRRSTPPGVGSPAACRFKFTESLRKAYTNSNGSRQEMCTCRAAYICKHSACLHTQKYVHNLVTQITLKVHRE